jgi:hypothetical protein
MDQAVPVSGDFSPDLRLFVREYPRLNFSSQRWQL